MRHTEVHINLTVLEVQDGYRKQYGGYKYVVNANGFSHTAFYTKEGLEYWLSITGLKVETASIDNKIELTGKYWTTSILGIDTYTNQKLMMVEEEAKIRERLLDHTTDDLDNDCVWMCNGKYTKGFIKRTAVGNIICYLNPNEPNRIVIPYFAVKS